jgi:hypothetical protein
MQAIITKFLGPTNSKGPRVKARCDAGSITVNWVGSYGSDTNHFMAAKALAEKLGWTGDSYGSLLGGSLPDGKGHCFVFVLRRQGEV